MCADRTGESTPSDFARQLIFAGKAPSGMRVPGRLDLSAPDDRASARGRRASRASNSRSSTPEIETRPPVLPDGLVVDLLDLSGRQGLTQLPRGLQAYELSLAGSGITRLPEDLNVKLRIDLTGCEWLESLPENLTVGTLLLNRCTSIVQLPEGLDVWSLDLTGCWAFDGWPERANIRSGRLQLRGCTALRSLPPYLKKLAAVNVRDCPNLTSLPEGLEITGWLDVAHSGLTSEKALPASLADVQLRWGGVPVDRRIAFHPELLRVDEVLAEKNAEVRRVMLDRYGYSRFLHDARAEVIDRDTDPGGPRQLLKLPLEGDEDLVAMSCFCPSTGRQYVIRVPPATPSCRHAAAWIAGYDDPDQYRPDIET